MIKSTPSCKPNQMRRRDKSGNYICCFTVICRQGQTFAFCEHDQSFDTCSNCPEGTYHLDTIDTSKMNTELDPCIPKPTCEQPEVRLENGKCICDRSLGYYGNDIYNCMLAEMKCSSPGFELKDNGKCEPCAEDFFKPEASTEHICRRKSSCHESQDIANNGSTTTDRSCKARTIMNLPAIKLTTENNDDNNDKNNMSNGNDERYSVLASIMERLENLETEVKRLTKSNRRINRKLNAKTRQSDKKRKARKQKRNQRKNKRKTQKTVTTDDNVELQKEQDQLQPIFSRSLTHN